MSKNKLALRAFLQVNLSHLSRVALNRSQEMWQKRKEQKKQAAQTLKVSQIMFITLIQQSLSPRRDLSELLARDKADSKAHFPGTHAFGLSSLTLVRPGSKMESFRL